MVNNKNSNLTIKTTKGKERTEIVLSDRSPRKISLTFERERLVSAGTLEQGSLNGIGYDFNKKEFEYEGEMKNGQLDGEGIKREVLTNKTIYGKFSKGELKTL